MTKLPEAIAEGAFDADRSARAAFAEAYADGAAAEACL